MNLAKNLFLTSLLVIFAALLGIGIFQVIQGDIHSRYQDVYKNHNPWYFPSRRHKHHPKRYNKNCLRGCRVDKSCPRGNLCYDCKGDDPSCCCYDDQCRGCE